MTSAPSGRTAGTATEDTAPAARQWLRTPVAAWAVIGALFLTAEALVMSRWAITGARWFPSGAYGLSPAGKLTVGAFQALSIAGVLFSIAWPLWLCMKRRSLTIEARLLVGYLSAFWLMPVVNYSGQVASYSKYLIATTDWGPFLPGWHGPNPDTHPVPLFVGWFALAEAMLWVLPTVWVLETAVRRRPNLSGPRLVLTGFSAAMAAELALEPIMVFSGGYIYASAVPALTLFAGHWYQIPVYATVIASLVYGLIPGLMCHYDHHHPQGAPILRGLQTLPRRARPWVATLSVIGMAQLTFLGLALSYAVISALGGVSSPDLPAHLR
ncbi:spirocyclase AveC family protein [Streptomyces sp. NBC_00648]|uniref:spirocyclase AveC family protein n=1 Tax=Streptomyces sp. NBC_00648 TaxID=2975797 RepID=UPI0032500169